VPRPIADYVQVQSIRNLQKRFRTRFVQRKWAGVSRSGTGRLERGAGRSAEPWWLLLIRWNRGRSSRSYHHRHGNRADAAARSESHAFQVKMNQLRTSAASHAFSRSFLLANTSSATPARVSSSNNAFNSSPVSSMRFRSELSTTYTNASVFSK
jgi:hypothetical protein